MLQVGPAERLTLTINPMGTLPQSMAYPFPQSLPQAPAPSP